MELFKKLATNQLEPFEVAFAEKAFESLSRNNLKNSVGFEQTLADLYAITYGGSRCVELDDILERSFPTLTEYMKEQNWLRNRFEDK
ncbi:MAG: hypothetical protein IPG59_01560 [Candidatus Melainabacteria bacterium]|nr:MAG: hypothetical protein IPG59_01560 [Candidatus Melainabacteria bacterium]